MSQVEMFKPELYMTPEDHDIAIEVMDWSSFYIDDSNECVIMRDCVRLSNRGFIPEEINIILDKTDNNYYKQVNSIIFFF